MRDDPALTPEAKSRIQDARNDKFLSVASIWEIAIKRSLGKLHLSVELSELVAEGTIPNGIGVLDVRTEHAVGVVALPFFHRNPFDRLLIAQALAERLTVVGGDTAFDAYPIRRIW